MAKKVAKKVPVKKTATKTKSKVTGTSKNGFEKVSVGTQFWKPTKVGDSVEGYYSHLEERPKYKGKKGETQNHVVLKNDEGDEIQCPAHWQLEKAVAKKGQGYYIFTVEKMGGKVVKGKEKTESYVYEIMFKE